MLGIVVESVLISIGRLQFEVGFKDKSSTGGLLVVLCGLH